MKNKFRKISDNLDSYIKTKQFRWIKGLILALCFTVTGCVCFLAGFFMNRDDNMIYNNRINAVSGQNGSNQQVSSETSGPEITAATEAPEVTEPEQTTVTTTEPPKITVDKELLDSYIHDDISVPDSEYSYTNTAFFENKSSLKEIGLPMTKKSFRIKYSGTITAGIDISKITVSADDDSYVITITLPDAELLSHEIDEDSFTLSNVKDNIFNPITDDDYINTCLSQNEYMEEKAIKSGIFEDVYSSTEDIISEYLNLDGIISSMYTIEFITPETVSEL